MPAAPCHLAGFVGPIADCTVERALVVDLFELTRRDWLHYDPEGARAAVEAFSHVPRQAGLDDSQLDWPAYVSYDQAQRIAELRHMRLLTSRQWIHVAVGRRSLVYPYGGPQPQVSWANTLELGLGTPAPVGTFESGRSQRFGCFDMLGNVWEWVEDVVPGYEQPATQVWSPLAEDRLASVMGGAFNSRSRRTFERWPLRFHSRRLDRSTVSPAVGVRMGADAEEYLWRMANAWGDGPEVRARVREVGRRWASASGRDVVLALLEELAGLPAAPESLSWLVEGASSAGATEDA